MLINLEDFQNYTRINKAWGYEIVLTNNEKYCAKLLGIRPGFRCSLHRHALKDETFFPMLGESTVEIMADGKAYQEFQLSKFSEQRSVRIEPGTWHRFWARGDQPAVLLEVSTPHADDDVERAEESGPWTPIR